MAARDIEAGRAHILLRIRNQLAQGLKNAKRQFSQFGRTMTTTFAVIGGGVAAGSLLWPLTMAGDLEQASVSFEVFLGSGQAAGQMLGDLRTMAAQTPFGFTDLRDPAQLLLGFGAAAQNVLPYLSMLGDVSGGNAERFQRLSLAFGQVLAKGRLMGQEVLQMTENGFNPLAEMSRVTGISMQTLMKRMEDGQISFQMLTQAMQSATGPGGRFNGLMQKQSTTLFGLFSQLKDYAGMAATTFGQTLLPIFKSLLTVGIGLTQWVTGFITRNQELVGMIGRVALGVVTIGAVLMGVGMSSMAMSWSLGVIAALFGSIFGLVTMLLSPVGLILGGILGIGYAAWLWRDAIVNLLAPLFEFIGGFDDLRAAWDAFSTAIASGNVEAAFAVVTAGINLAWLTATTKLAEVWRTVVAYVLNVWTSVISNLTIIALKGFTQLQNAWDGLATGMRIAIINAISTAAKLVIDLIARMQIAMLTAEQLATGKNNNVAILQAEGSRLFQLKKLEDERQAAGSELAGGLMQRQGERTADTNAMVEQIMREAEATMAGRLEGLSGEALTEAQAQLAAARQALNEAMKAAKAEPTKKETPILAQLNAGMGALPAAQSRGTFSAAGAAMFGGGTNGINETAQNTRELVRLAKKKEQQPVQGAQGPAFS
jgi:tape measure domain-containing protein